MKRRIAVHQSYTSSLVSAKPRSLLKLDQAYIAVGVGGNTSLSKERPTSCAPLRCESPPEMQRCRVAHNLPTRCRVPTSAHNLPHLSPVGTKPDAHRIGSRAPLGLDPRAAELQTCVSPWYAQYPNGRETSPRIPLPPGRADGSAKCLSLHTLVHGRLTVGVKRHSGPGCSQTRSRLSISAEAPASLG